MFNYQTMDFTCVCGLPSHNIQVGVSSHLCLAVEWECTRCRHTVVVCVAFEELIRNAPQHPETTYTQQDTKLLGEMGITV